MSALRAILAAACGPVLIALPDVAAACAVCTGGDSEQSALAFRYATAFMSVLPLAMIGAGVLWLRRRIRQVESEESEIRARVPAAR